MEEFYSDDSVTLYKGDALRILQTLPDACVDAVITDPPYSSGGVTLTARQMASEHKYQSSGVQRRYPPLLGDGKDQRAFTTWAMLWLAECWRIAKDGVPLLLFTDWRQLPSMTDALQGAGWFWIGIVVWDKRGSRPHKGRFRHQCEYVLVGSKGKFTPTVPACFPGLYACPINAKSKVHLTGKPLPLFLPSRKNITRLG